jgi:anti-sigma regulatory factor (Ser/Thr protein kinase)
VITREQIDTVLGDGRAVIGHDGHDLGHIARVFPDARSGQPAWMTVTSDIWDGAELVVPLGLARLVDGAVQVPYSSTVVQAAPRAPTFPGHLGRRHEEDLALHYGLAGAAAGSPARSGRAWHLPCTAHSVRALRLELRSFLDVTGLPGDELDDLVLAASEAATNAIEHARTPVPGYFDVLADVEGTRVQITVRDHGRWREPTPRGGPGRGLLLMRNLSALTVTVEPGGTTVTMRNRSSDRGLLSFRRRR